MIPYNPSSFNSNKTILEQILELKRWLIQHPSYKLYTTYLNYYPTENRDVFFNDINGDLDFIESIAIGDIIVFGDANYASVESVTIDPDDITNSYATIAIPVSSFRGPQGPQGADGANGTNGADGTCIRKYSGNSNANPSTYYAISLLNFNNGLQQYDLIYFNDGYAGFVSNVNVGLSSFQISARFYVNGQNGADGAYVSNASVDANGDLIITIYDPETSIASQVNAGYVVGSDGNDGISVTNVTIDGNSHLIVTLSDGSTIDAGSVSSGGIEVVELTSNTGTLSVDDFNKVNSYNCVIIRNNNIYVRERSSVYNTIKYCCSFADGSILKQTLVYTINLSTRGYTHASNVDTITEYSITSNIATNGQVLTADGNGNCSWQNVSGGSFTDYVTITGVSGTFSDSDYNKLLQNDSVIINSDNKRIYAKYSEDNYNIVYENYYIYQNSLRRSYITITKSTKTWTHDNTYPTISTNNFYSGTATSGQVLTANGSGGASWQNASSGAQIFRYNASTIDFTRLINIVKNGHIVSGTYEMIVGGVNRIINANTIFNRTDNANRIYIDGEVGGYGSNQVNIWIFSGQIDSTGILPTYSQAILLSNDGQSVTYRILISDMKNIDIYYIASSEITQ